MPRKRNGVGNSLQDSAHGCSNPRCPRKSNSGTPEEPRISASSPSAFQAQTQQQRAPRTVSLAVSESDGPKKRQRMDSLPAESKSDEKLLLAESDLGGALDTEMKID